VFDRRIHFVDSIPPASGELYDSSGSILFETVIVKPYLGPTAQRTPPEKRTLLLHSVGWHVTTLRVIPVTA
jgi:hypothetical protein